MRRRGEIRVRFRGCRCGKQACRSSGRTKRKVRRRHGAEGPSEDGNEGSGGAVEGSHFVQETQPSSKRAQRTWLVSLRARGNCVAVPLIGQVLDSCCKCPIARNLMVALVAGACNHPNCLVLPFSVELIRLAAEAAPRRSTVIQRAIPCNRPVRTRPRQSIQ